MATTTTTTSQTSPYGTTRVVSRNGNRTAYWAITIAVLVVAALIYMFTRDNVARTVPATAPVQQAQGVAVRSTSPDVRIVTPDVRVTTPNVEVTPPAVEPVNK